MSKFEVDGVFYEFVDSPTFGEGRSIEKMTGKPWSALENEQTVDLLQALVWISMKRTNPDLTFDDIDDIDMSVLAQLQSEPEVPTEAEVDTTSASSDSAI